MGPSAEREQLPVISKVVRGKSWAKFCPMREHLAPTFKTIIPSDLLCPGKASLSVLRTPWSKERQKDSPSALRGVQLYADGKITTVGWLLLAHRLSSEILKWKHANTPLKIKIILCLRGNVCWEIPVPDLPELFTDVWHAHSILFLLSPKAPKKGSKSDHFRTQSRRPK